MALVLCFHFQLGELGGLNMSVVSKRMSSQSCSVWPPCNCLFVVDFITAVCWCTLTIYALHNMWTTQELHHTLTAKCLWFYMSLRNTVSYGLKSCVNVCVFALTTVCSSLPGQHRSLGPHLSKVRSLKLDSSVWSNELVEVFYLFLLLNFCNSHNIVKTKKVFKRSLK